MTTRFGAIPTPRLDNYEAAVDPTVNDDSGDGYDVGSWWFNTTSGDAFICVDSTVGAAVWMLATVPLIGGGIECPWVAPMFTSVSNNLSATSAFIGLVEVPGQIPVASITFRFGTQIGSVGSLGRIAVYSFDGQTKLIDVTFAGNQTVSTDINVAVSPAVTLPAGFYYLLVCRGNTTGPLPPSVRLYTTLLGSTANSVLAGPAATNQDVMGTRVITGGAAPPTIDPTGLSVTRQQCLVCRFDDA